MSKRPPPTYRWTGFTEVCEAAEILLHGIDNGHGGYYVCGPTVGSHLVIARFFSLFQREHSITPLSRNQV